MDPYAVLKFLWAALPFVVVVVVLVLGILFAVRDANGQRALTALALRIIDALAPGREAAIERASRKVGKS